MAQIRIIDEDITLDNPHLVEGLPGVGLVGKIAADHLIEAFDMEQYANIYCDELPKVARYDEGQTDLSTPLRLYINDPRDLLVLQSDIPISPDAATEFAQCVQGWFERDEVTPIYLSGMPHEKDTEPPALYGVSSGTGGQLLSEAGVEKPSEGGLVTGPTGALLAHAFENDFTAVGLVVESDPKFPDPEAARVLIKEGIEPLSGIDVPVDHLVERASEIRQAKEQLAEQMQTADQESTQAKPLRMYQ